MDHTIRNTAFSLLVILSLASLGGCRTDRLGEQTDYLDYIIENKQLFTQKKEQNIAALKRLFDVSTLRPEQKYEINQRLYDEYRKYILDSAVVYIERNVAIARELDSYYKLQQSLLQLAPLYSFSGKYIEANAILKSIDVARLSDDLKSKYYEAYIQFYDHYSMVSSQDKFHRLQETLRDSLLEVTPPDSRTYRSNYVTKLMSLGDASSYEAAEKMLTDLLSETPEDTPDYASSMHQLAKLNQRMGRPEQAKKYYTISAITDIRCAIKETSALQNLALIYFDEGEDERAFRYAQSAVEDAVFGGAQLRTTQMSKFYSIINATFRDKENAAKQRLQGSLLFISLLLLCLVLLIVQILRQMKKLSRIKERLSETNGKLLEQNKKIIEINNLLTESNVVKERYITQFFDLHSNYIDKFENYRKSLNRLAMNRQMNELFKQLKSTEFAKNEINELYRHFDTIFLGLYPTFVTDFNSLLEKDERIVLKSGDLLNRELRIYALLRLGITDSAQIASFLRCSITTVYNYRTKARNRAAISRDDFEVMVRKIGSLEPQWTGGKAEDEETPEPSE